MAKLQIVNSGNPQKGKKIITIKIPLWVLKELISEKKGWVKDNLSRNEEPSAFEKWIVDNLPKQLKKKKEKL